MIGEMLRAAPAATANLWPFWRALRGIPMLAIRGAQSDILSAATFAKMKAENPELAQLEVAQRGHAPLLDEPECVAAIDALLGRFPDRRLGGRGYLRHKVGVNRTRMVNTSSLPSSMAAEHTQV